MKKATIYARVSTKKQGDKGTSISAQLRLCREYAAKNDMEIVAEYVETQSGRVERKKFNQMLEDAKQKRFEVVLVWKFNRFSRNQETSIVKKHLLRKIGVDVVSITQPIDKENLISNLAERITEVFDEHFSENLAQDTLRGQLEKTRQGYQMGMIPWGYVKVDGSVVLSEDSDKIRIAFEQFATGNYTLDQWVNKAHELGYQSKGKKVYKSRWYHMFRNTFYAGFVKWAGVKAKGKHQALVDSALFDKVQKILSERGHIQKVKRDYILVNLVWSLNANSKMVGHCGTARNGDVKRYYKSVLPLADKKYHYVNADQLENELTDFLLKIGISDKISVDNLPQLDDSLKLALKVAPSIGLLWPYLDFPAKNQLSKLVVKEHGLKVRGHNLKIIELNPPFCFDGGSTRYERPG